MGCSSGTTCSRMADVDESKCMGMASVYDTKQPTACVGGCKPESARLGPEMCVFYIFLVIYSLTRSLHLASIAEEETGVLSEDCDNHRDHPCLPSRNPTQPEPSHNHSQPRKDSEDYSLDTIHRLMQHPALLDPMRRPRYPIVLCHGMNTVTVNSSRKYCTSNSFIIHRTIWL